MKKLLFKKMTLLSNKEKKGRIIQFHKKATVLKGENDVGKSSIIKTLFKTFGTEPYKETDRWKDAGVQSLVDFSVDDIGYSLLRSRSSFGLFDHDDALIDTFSNVTNELSPALAELFDFHLALTTKQNSTNSQATPAFLFLPFYADQDNSWVKTFDSFQRLTQFSNYRRDVIWFHTGIRPNEFYRAKTEKFKAEELQEKEKTERDVLLVALQKVEELFEENQLELRVEDFEKEIERLLEQSGILVEREASLKEKIVATRNMQLAIDSQLAIVIKAAAELDEDFAFASKELDDIVECPTCGAHYENSIAERFAIAADEDRCRELIEELQEEKRKLELEYRQSVEKASEVETEISQIDKLLLVRRGEVNFQQVLQSEGRREVRDAINVDLTKMNTRIGQLDQLISLAEKQMKMATDRKRSREIKEFYAERISEFLDDLAVETTSAERYKKIDCKINESGSDGPRGILAYLFAILHTIHEHTSSVFCPIVLDSPNQQDQDESNLPRILKFIRSKQPEPSQLILAVVDDLDVDFGGAVIEFDEKYGVLKENQFGKSADRIRPMIDQMIERRASR